MKKTYVTPLQEILDTDITNVQEYLEQAFAVFATDLLQISSGVISGLAVSSGSLTTLSVATGYIHMDRVFGALESASGITLSLPVSGTRTDLLVAYYSEVYDTPATGYVLLDVSLGTESIQTRNTRKFGSIVIEQLTDTSYATRPYNKVPLCELTMSSSGVTAMSDVRIYARIMRLQDDFAQNFHSMFFAGF